MEKSSPEGGKEGGGVSGRKRRGAGVWMMGGISKMDVRGD